MTSPNNPIRDSRHLNALLPFVAYARRPLSTDIRHPETGRIYPTPYFWRVRNQLNGSAPATGSEGELYYLEDITANVADWKKLIFTAGSTGIETISGDAGGAVSGDGGGDLDLIGTTVANAANSKPVFIQGTSVSFKQDVQVQVASDRTGAPANKNDAGLCSFDDTTFVVDTHGYVTLVGGGSTPPTVSYDIDINTVPGTDPVLNDGSAQVGIFGNVVAAHSVPVETHSRAANAFNVEVQVGSAVTGAPGNKNACGLVQFDDTSFVVNSDGYVTLAGGAGPAIDTVTGDSGGAIAPDGTGNLGLTGLTVASATNSKPVFVAGASNAQVVQVQVGAAVTGAPGNKTLAGLVQFDDSDFQVDADGYVTLSSGGAGQTITGDSGGALSPSGSNWNILGLSGSKTSGSGSTLTIKSPPYSDVGATGTSVINSGEFVTGNYTRTLPASPSDGDLVEFVCTTANALIITANTGQAIRNGSAISTTAGTATSTAIGDSLILRFRSTDSVWYAKSSIGTWILA